MFGIWQDAPYHLPGALKKQLRQIKERFGIHTELDSETDRDPELAIKIETMVGRIYGELSIIDGKVSALTQASALLLFVASLGLTAGFGIDPKTNFFAAIILSFGLLFLAILFCLSVVFLYWFRFGQNTARANDDELIRLLKIRNGRSRRYRIGWLLTAVGSVVIAFGFLGSAIERAGLSFFPY